MNSYLSSFDVQFITLDREHVKWVTCQSANMLQNTRKTTGFKKIMDYKIPPVGR